MKTLLIAVGTLLGAVLPAFTQDLDKGVELYESKNYVGADKLLRQTIDNEPDNPKALQYLGLALTREGKPSEAEAFLRKASDLDPEIGVYPIGAGRLTD